MFKKYPAARRVLIYMIFSYIALVLVNNSSIEADNMWVIYTPMFILIYIFSRWLDSRLGSQAATDLKENETPKNQGFGE